MKIKGVPIYIEGEPGELRPWLGEIELSAEDLARQLTKHDIDMLHLCKIEEKVIKAIKNELIPQEME